MAENNIKIKELEEKIARLNTEILEQQDEIHLLKYVINQLPGCIYWKSVDGVYLGHNQASARKMQEVGLVSEDIVGKTDHELFPTSVADTYQKNDLQVIETDSELVQEELFHQEGNCLTQLSTKKTLKNQQGEIVGVVGSTVDITEKKQAEKEAEQARLQIEKANQSKGLLLSALSEEIARLLNGCLLGLELLFDKVASQNKKTVQDILHSLQRVPPVIGLASDYVQLELEPKPYCKDPIDLCSSIYYRLSKHQYELDAKGVELKYAYDSKLPKYVIGYSRRLGQVLDILISNAARFTDHGAVHVSAYPEISKNGEALLTIDISDTGVGITQESLDVLFDFFSSTTSEKKYKNTGPRLALSKRIVESFGGSLSVKSEVGVGSTFSVKFPLIPYSGEVKTNAKVLLVEDDIISAKFFIELLSKKGLKVDWAKSGEEALEYIGGIYSMVFMDIGLPNMSGILTAEKIKTNDAHKGTPIVAVTAYMDEVTEETCFNSGFFEVIRKPIRSSDIDDLLLKVNNS